jgi:O-antigen/teichoic acid export membrane protein
VGVRGKVLRVSAMLWFSRIACILLVLLRNVLVARRLSPEDFGLAATFWITTGILKAATDLGFQKHLIQSKDGDDERFGAVAQSLFLLRGLLIGAVLLVAAGPIARAFGSPEATWAFRMLALLPIANGLKHREITRLKRELRFGPQVVMTLTSQLVATVAAVPIASATRDYRAILYLVLLQEAVAVAASHLLAKRPFRLAWDRATVGRFLRFGWPLLINSLLLWGMTQGDRLILAGAYSREELGVYSLAMGLVMSAFGMVTTSVNPVVFALMARAQDDRATVERHLRLHTIAMAAFGALTGIGFIVLGPLLVTLLYGAKYALAGTVVGLLGIGQGLRMLRLPAQNAAMARGDTLTSLYTNVIRQFGIVLALLAAWRRLPFEWIAVASIGGELLAVCAAGMLLRGRHAIPLGALWRPGLFVCACYAVSVVGAGSLDLARVWWTAGLCFVVIAGIGTAVYLGTFPGFRCEVTEALASVSRRFRSPRPQPIAGEGSDEMWAPADD